MMPSLPMEGENREAWNEAARRVRLYLKALDFDEVGILDLQGLILSKALAAHPGRPSALPLELAHGQMRLLLGERFQQKLALPVAPVGDEFWKALLACKLADSPETSGGPRYEKSGSTVIEASSLFSFPLLHATSMTPRPMDYGPLPDLERAGRTRWLPVVYVFLLWTAIYLLGYAGLTFLFHGQ